MTQTKPFCEKHGTRDDCNADMIYRAVRTIVFATCDSQIAAFDKDLSPMVAVRCARTMLELDEIPKAIEDFISTVKRLIPEALALVSVENQRGD